MTKHTSEPFEDNQRSVTVDLSNETISRLEHLASVTGGSVWDAIDQVMQRKLEEGSRPIEITLSAEKHAWLEARAKAHGWTVEATIALILERDTAVVE